MDEIASESVLNQAYAWLCERRVNYSPNDDVWDVRWRWEELRPKLQDWLRAGVYRIGAVRRFPAGDDTIEVWSALDALVLKAIAHVLCGLARLGLRPEGAGQNSPGQRPRCYPQVSRPQCSRRGRTYPKPRPGRTRVEGRSTGFVHLVRCCAARRNRPGSQSNEPFLQAGVVSSAVAHA